MRRLTVMKQFESLFLGLILAGVLLMVVGLTLMSARPPDGASMIIAQRQALDPFGEPGMHRPIEPRGRVNDDSGLSGTKPAAGR